MKVTLITCQFWALGAVFEPRSTPSTGQRLPVSDVIVHKYVQHNRNNLTLIHHEMTKVFASCPQSKVRGRSRAAASELLNTVGLSINMIGT